MTNIHALMLGSGIGAGMLLIRYAVRVTRNSQKPPPDPPTSR